jgi:FkbM family methyltransferase
MLKKIIKALFPKRIISKLSYFKNNYLDGYAVKSYSQEGEDLILNRIFEQQKKGFYVDVGAHHPKRFSNTYIFYKKGWHGINIDAMPGGMKLFEKFRPRDINIEKAISDKKQTLTYYIFNEPALNGFSEDLSKLRSNKENYFIKSTKKIETLTLVEVLDKYLPNHREIDFLSIDVEGLDYNVLKSHDFKKYRPKIILIEILESDLDNIYTSEIAKFLNKVDYRVYVKLMNTIFFVCNTFYKERC